MLDPQGLASAGQLANHRQRDVSSMLDFYAVKQNGLELLQAPTRSADLFEKALWIDAHEPTPAEEAFLEEHLKLDIPTREEMRDLEESSRLYQEGGALYMTAIIVSGASRRRPVKSEITFVVTPKHLITIRYVDPLAIKTFQQKCQRQPDAHNTSELVFSSLVEQIVQRIAELLEKITADLDSLAAAIFEEDAAAIQADKDRNITQNLQELVRRLGRNAVMIGKLRESLLSFSRLLSFCLESGESWISDGVKLKLKTLDRDVQSLAAYEENLAGQIGYLQDATFNLINIEQNRVIKVFTIAAVLFLPPTMVATIYGMNFQFMPELKWALGYPFSLALMVGSALVPYIWFKRNGWF
jgi:magnesium transporter